MKFPFHSILVTGGAGFVGSNLALKLKQHFAGIQVMAFDNLKRRGSELNLPRLKSGGVDFIHGDIRCEEDLDQCPRFDLLVDASAEPSVLAGLAGSPAPVVRNNLTGTLNCLEAARKNKAAFWFLSTSRIYPIEPINALAYTETATRFEWNTCAGIDEAMPLNGHRSLYGATKLAGELILQEYVWTYNLPALVNRCGVLCGPWQMGKADQGVVTLWVARHLYAKPLAYIGFGGIGKQVRDILHIDDLFDLLLKQAACVETWRGATFNVGGGRSCSVSLLELTQLVRDATGRTIDIASRPETSPVDLRIYLSDTVKVNQAFDWQPSATPTMIVRDIASWIEQNHDLLQPVFG